MLNAIEHLCITGVVVYVCVSADVCDFEIAELNAFDGVAVGFAVAGELIHYLRIAEDGLDACFIADTGRNV